MISLVSGTGEAGLLPILHAGQKNYHQRAIQLSAIEAQEVQSTVPQALYPAAVDVLTQKLNGRGK